MENDTPRPRGAQRLSATAHRPVSCRVRDRASPPLVRRAVAGCGSSRFFDEIGIIFGRILENSRPVSRGPVAPAPRQDAKLSVWHLRHDRWRHGQRGRRRTCSSSSATMVEPIVRDISQILASRTCWTLNANPRQVVLRRAIRIFTSSVHVRRSLLPGELSIIRLKTLGSVRRVALTHRS